MKAAPISHTAMHALGWVRMDPRPWAKLAAYWWHCDGWSLQHCGHQTAICPWLLKDQHGRVHLSGGQNGDPTKGRAWSTLKAAAEYVRDRGAKGMVFLDRREDAVARVQP